MEYMEVLIKILGKNYHLQNDWWPHCNCSKNECKFYSKCFSFVKKHKQKVKNKKKILEKLADNEVYNI